MQESHITINTSSFRADRRGAVALFAGLFFLIISIAVYGGLYFLNASQRQSQAELVQQIQQKEDDLRPKVLDQIYTLKKKFQTVSGVISSHVFAANTFGILETDTHPRVSFDSYSFSPSDDKIMLKGKADDYGVLAQQITFLEGDPRVDRVEFGGLSLHENNRVSFDLSIYLTKAAISTPRQ